MEPAAQSETRYSVLVFAPDWESASHFRNVLSSGPYVAVVTLNPRDALELLSIVPFDLVLMAIDASPDSRNVLLQLGLTEHRARRILLAERAALDLVLDAIENRWADEVLPREPAPKLLRSVVAAQLSIPASVAA